MFDLDKIFKTQPYSYEKQEKEAFLTQILSDLTWHHYQNCLYYRGILDALNFNPKTEIKSYLDIPFLPVSLFKNLELRSIKEEDIFKTMTSSGTTGQAVSKIYLDRVTASNQQKALVKIVSNFTGRSRMPMLIIDCPSVIKDKNLFSARGAGILGFSIFGTDKTYVLDDDMNLKLDAVEEFLEKHQEKPFLIFGFTFMIWQYLYKELIGQNKKLDLSQGILIHGGGWKKLQNESVSPQVFKDSLGAVCSIKKIHDYYGMVEQTGCIYMECEEGHLHASIYSDIITRRSIDFTPCDIGETGIIEVVSILPKSYPGHVLLTEDEGVILGEDDCPCGRAGKYFKINGRLKNAEIRGCSDTYGS